MKIEAYKKLKSELNEIEEFLSVVGQDQEFGKARLVISTLSADLVTYQQHASKYSGSVRELNAYLREATQHHIESVIATARELMRRDLIDAAKDAQEECVELLQKIGQDKK
ncbi:hypothetical protein [Nitrosomonas sp. Nm58]|uniref:hypothetical protein n=1 Tax=Nitrosomonas sp. Nm58 TaxID=200126 RepID=UPI00089BCB05|nr:hypothetical protein [Nitrosomonas sp. Nm58]SDY37597.1 hypothetical protein SAMN05421754_100811 [Nitrosomonas sp. Nm58]